jgi:ABC-2 type transport system ATP-binding protein
MKGSEADVQRLLKQLVAADCGLISFAEQEPTLEDVFMLVTKGLVT